MSIKEAREHLRRWHRDADIVEFSVSTATVELAAKALGVEPARIAKTLSFRSQNDDASVAILVVTAGDVKVDNALFKAEFGIKPRMLSADQVLELTGHPAGGVCPFGVRSGCKVYLDTSLRRFDQVFPACGSDNTAIRLTPDELAEYALSERWVKVTRPR